MNRTDEIKKAAEQIKKTISSSRFAPMRFEKMKWINAAADSIVNKHGGDRNNVVASLDIRVNGL